MGARSALSRAVAARVTLPDSHVIGRSSHKTRMELHTANDFMIVLYLFQETGHRKRGVHHVDVLTGLMHLHRSIAHIHPEGVETPLQAIH
jgi:hypothetical protein